MVTKAEKVVEYVEMLGRVPSGAEVGRKVGCSGRFARDVILKEKLREKYPAESAKRKAKAESKPELNIKELSKEAGTLKDLNWRDIFENARRTQKVEEKLSNVSKKPVEIEIEPDRHGFGRLVFSGDWHIGNMGTDYEALEALIRYIKKTKMGIVGLADYIENFIRPIGGNWIPILNQALPPKHQKAAYFSILKEISDNIKLLLIEWHDNREKRATSMDTMDFLNWSFPIRENRTILIVKCGKATYKGVVAHRLPGKSMYHATHDGLRELLFSSPDADFIVSAHSHVPGDLNRAYRGRKVPIIKVGAFNNDADYAVASYGAKSFISAPVLIFDSKKRISTPIQFPGFYLDKIISPLIEDIK